MAKRIETLSRRAFKGVAEKLLRPVKYGENGIGVCYPSRKIAYDIHLLLENKVLLREFLGKYHNKFLMVVVDLEEEDKWIDFLEKLASGAQRGGLDVRRNDDLETICMKTIEVGRELYIFISGLNLLGKEDLNSILTNVHKELIDKKRLGAMVFVEANIYSGYFLKLFNKHNKFMQNVSFFPTLSIKESEKFINNLIKAWKMKISEKLVKQIAKESGGYLWILREAVRYARDSETEKIDEIMKSYGISMRIEAIYGWLSDQLKRDLIEICFGDYRKANAKNFDYLKRVGMITQVEGKYSLTLKLLEEKLKKKAEAQNLLVNDKKRVIYKDKDVTHIFSRSEITVLQVLEQHRGLLMTRESLAKTLWGDDWVEKYSDWALDKLISRLRKSLVGLGLSKKSLITKKGSGFVLI